MTTELVNPSNDIEVKSFYNEAIKLQEYAEARVILVAEDLKPAVDDLSIIAKVKKALEGKRKEYVVPLQDQVKEVNEVFKTLMEPILVADKTTRTKILSYQQEQERIRQEQERINTLKMEAAKAEAALHNGEITESVNLVEVIAPLPKHIRTNMGMTGTMKVRKWEIIDFASVPDELKVIDAGKVTKLVRAGIGSIAGIHIYEEATLRVTPAKA